MTRAQYIKLMREGGFKFTDQYAFIGTINAMYIWHSPIENLILLVVQPSDGDPGIPSNDLIQVSFPNNEDIIDLLIFIKDNLLDKTDEVITYIKSLPITKK